MLTKRTGLLTATRIVRTKRGDGPTELTRTRDRKSRLPIELRRLRYETARFVIASFAQSTKVLAIAATTARGSLQVRNSGTDFEHRSNRRKFRAKSAEQPLLLSFAQRPISIFAQSHADGRESEGTKGTGVAS